MKRWKKGVIIASAIVGIAAIIGGIAIRHVTYLRYPEGKDHIDYRDVPDNILLREVYIPSSAEYIARFTFYFCESLRRVELNEGLHAIGARAFSGCRKLREMNLPTTVNFIGAGAFHFCDNLQTVQMPPVLDSIRDHTFSYCFRLREINIPDSLVYIGISAFDMCNSLTHVETCPPRSTISARVRSSIAKRWIASPSLSEFVRSTICPSATVSTCSASPFWDDSTRSTAQPSTTATRLREIRIPRGTSRHYRRLLDRSQLPELKPLLVETRVPPVSKNHRKSKKH